MFGAILCLALVLIFFLKISPWLLWLYRVNKALSKVDGPDGHWLLGQSQILSFDEKGYKLTVKRMVEKFPKVQRIIWMNPFIQSLVLYWPSSVKAIYSSHFPKDELWYDQLLKPWLGNGLLISRGKKWLRNRRLLTPAFHYGILKTYVEIFNECSSIFVKKMEEKQSIEAFEHVSLMTLDVILQTAMSSKTNCQLVGKRNEYINAVYEIGTAVMKRILNPLHMVDFIYYRTAQGKQFTKMIDFAHAHTAAIISARRKELENKSTSDDIKNKKRHDFLDILLLAKDSDGVEMTDLEIRDEVDTFLFEGHDTTASGISWALYNLAMHKQHQNLCRKEIKEILQGREYVTSEDLPKFHYLTKCLKESMRIHPPVMFVVRNVTDSPLKFTKDFGSDQYNVSSSGCPAADSSQTFPLGTRAEINIYCLHHNPHVWKGPEQYDPNRFTESETAKRSPYAYTPFAAGSRNCIGQNFAMMEMKIALAKIFQRFQFAPDPSHPKPFLSQEGILKSKTGIHLLINPVK